MPIARCLLLSLGLLASTALPADAQRKYCDSAQFNSLTNIWKPMPDQNTGDLTAVELAAERKIMGRVLEMFKSAYVPNGAIGYHAADYQTGSQVATNPARYGNPYEFILSNHKIECVNDKPVAIDVSLGNVGVLVNKSFVDEAIVGDSAVGFSFLPRGYYQRKDKTALPEANADGIQEFNFGNGTTVWWLTRAGALPFRYVTRREFLEKQIEIQRTRGASEQRIAYYQGLLNDSPNEVAIVKNIEVPSLNGYAHVFTTLADRESRVYVTLNPDYYDRRQPKSAPQHILIRLQHGQMSLLNSTGIGARHLESFQKLREIVRANLAELRGMVK